MLPKDYLEMDLVDYADLTIQQQRAVYRELRDIVRYTVGVDNADNIIRACCPGVPVTPVDWIMAVFRVEVDCERCKGTGTYYWGASINGRMTHSGPCARCGGDGRMTFDDMRRCRAYDNYAIYRACR